MQEETVKWPSKKKHNCKRNKGEHEYSPPVIVYRPEVRYIYKTDNNCILNSPNLHPEYKYLKTEITLATETRCIHCDKKEMSFFNQSFK